MSQNSYQTKCLTIISGSLVSSVLLSSMFLSTSLVSADADDRISIQVPVSCTMSSTGTDSHNASIENGTYNSAIGETTLKALCNDASGFAIYAIGYTDNEDGNNVLASSTLSSTYDITTGTATSGNNSKWAMKLSTISSPTPTYTVAIQNSFDNFHAVPDDYTLVAKRLEGTDVGQGAEGATLKTTYQVYIASTQPAGAYSGKVKYTLVHPASTPTPKSTMLDTGQVVGAKMKTLAAGGTTTAYNTKTSDIKAIRMADSLPNGFVATEANTVSAATSRHPIYIFFDNTNDAGIMYFYSGGYQVVMNSDSQFLFFGNLALADVSGLADWDASNVATMYAMFTDSIIGLTNLDALARWDTSSVENMAALFAMNGGTVSAGYISSLVDISGLMNWNTSSVTNMYMMFQNASSLISLHGLEFWDVSKVENMRLAFAGGSSTMALSDISALSNWDTRSVTTTRAMFQRANYLTDLSPLANWNVSNVEDMQQMFSMTAGSSKPGDPIIDLSPLAKWNVSNVTNMRLMFLNNNIASFLPLANWNVGKVQDFDNMFNQTNKSTTTTLAGLENWNVSSATNMGSMFADSVSLTDASAINGWDVRNVIPDTSGNENTDVGFNQMFKNSPVHSAFTLRAGTWNSNGTFIPSS